MNHQEITIRWMIRSDFSDVIILANSEYPDYWNFERLQVFLRHRNTIGLVVEHNFKLIGYAIYILGKSELTISNLVVDKNVRRQGVGTLVIDALKSKLSRRKTLKVIIDERRLSTQLFFKSCGFKAIGILRGSITGFDQDGYMMEFSKESKSPGVNRIQAYLEHQ